MSEGFLRLTDVRPWYIRLLLLLVIGSPTIMGGAVHVRFHDEHYFVDLLQWTAYAVFVWLFIVACLGLKKLVEWLSVAFYIALVILFTGAVFRGVGVWERLAELLGVEFGTPDQGVKSLVRTFVILVVVYPLSLLVLTSFPASDLIKWISLRVARVVGSSTKLGLNVKAAVVLALLLRMLQHVAEVVERCLLAWQEENPAWIVPRHRADWSGSLLGRAAFFDFARTAIVAWVFAVTFHSFVVLPTLVKDFRRVTGGRFE